MLLLLISFTTLLLLHGAESGVQRKSSFSRYQKRDTNYPVWPDEFKWYASGAKSGYTCMSCDEPAEWVGYEWDDNYFCWLDTRDDPGFEWSTDGPIDGLTCIQIEETEDPLGWDDNYLCYPDDVPYDFSWSQAGPISGLECIKWYEWEDPYSWRDNYLCASDNSGLFAPVFPDDFKYSQGGIPSGYDCVRILETAEVENDWNNNYFCWKDTTADPGLVWNSAGPIDDMRCTNINEPADKYSWSDNYLCVAEDSDLRLIWSYDGEIEDHSCIQWYETSDGHGGWGNNYLCSELCQLTTVEVLEPDQYETVAEGTQILGSVSAASCMVTSGTYSTIMLTSADSTTETTSVVLTDTSEINWGLSVSVAVEASVGIFGTGGSVTVTAETSVGGAYTWSRSEETSWATSSEVGVGHTSTYNNPGGAVMFGDVVRYKFDQTDIPVMLHYSCPSSGTFEKASTIDMVATSHQSANYETLSGEFYEDACEDTTIVDCVKLVDDQYSTWFGDMVEVREAFKYCFDGRGVGEVG